MIFKRTLSFLIFLALTLTASVNVVQAASSAWQDLGGGKVRLVAYLDPTTNKVSGVVEVRLEEGWSTYWRYPGSSGIPPLFDFSGSTSYTTNSIKFPAPQLIQQPYGAYAGYKTKVMFPFEGELGSDDTAKISLNLLIGVCAEVCIPATAKLQITSDQLLQSDPLALQAVSFAKITIPKIVEHQSTLIKRTQVDEKTLQIEIKHNKSFGTPSLFVEGPSDWYLLPAELVLQSNTSATFKLDVSRAPQGTDFLKHKLRYTLVTGKTGVEMER